MLVDQMRIYMMRAVDNTKQKKCDDLNGVMGYKIYIPELKEIVIGVNCLFNEVIPTYTEDVCLTKLFPHTQKSILPN